MFECMWRATIYSSAMDDVLFIRTDIYLPPNSRQVRVYSHKSFKKSWYGWVVGGGGAWWPILTHGLIGIFGVMSSRDRTMTLRWPKEIHPISLVSA